MRAWRIFTGRQNNFVFLILCILLFLSLVTASFWSEWEEHPGNPVLDPTDSTIRAYYPSVIYDSQAFNENGDNAFYKMWFAQGNGIGYAFSQDGINWVEYNSSLPLNSLQSGASHPYVIYYEPGFENGMCYRIWYWDTSVNLASVEAIRTAESTDGIIWQNDQPISQHASDPALQLLAGFGVYNNYFYHTYGPGSILFNPTGTNLGAATPDDKTDDQPMSYRYIMYYDSSSEGFSPEGSQEQTSLAYSSNGFYWTRYGDEPVLLPSGNQNGWDGWYSYRGSVVKIGNEFHMWYAGANGDNNIGTYYAHGIGHALSQDGLTWVKDTDNPIFHVTDGLAWRDVRTYTPAVIYDNAQFSGHGDSCPGKMWFNGRTGSNYTIGYATLPAPPNDPPIAAFNCIPTGRTGQTRCFDASPSSDPDGDLISQFQWTLTSRPPGSDTEITPGDSINSCLIPDTQGHYTISLRVASLDGLGNTQWSEETTCDYRVTTKDQLPIAIISDPPLSGKVGEKLFFDGSSSYDPDGDSILNFAWEISSKPVVSNLTIGDPQSNAIYLTPDAEGDYVFCLRVASANLVWSQPHCVAITVKDFAYCNCPQITLQIEHLVDRMWHQDYGIAKLSWTSIPVSPACSITSYRIYRMDQEQWTRIIDVPADTFTYEDAGVKEWHPYKVTALWTDGQECEEQMSLEERLLYDKITASRPGEK